MARKKEFKIPVTVLIGSSISNLRKIARNKEVEPAYRSKYLATAAVSSILTPFGKIDRALNKKKINNTEISAAPVFIIAFWRSGTTLLHNLMCQNPEFAYVSTFQTVFPNHTLSNQWWLKFVASPFIPERRPADNMKLEWNNPQEEEMALGNMQHTSFYNFMYFPKNFDEFVENGLIIDHLSPDELKEWKEDYRRMVKIAMINTGGRRLISKNPPNAFRIRHILDMFPDAKFINITRDKEEVINSFQRFMKGVFEGTALQEINDETLERNFRDLFRLHAEKIKEGKQLIPKENFLEIDYPEFIENKLDTMQRIYDTFRLEGYAKALPMMQRYLDETKDFKPWDYRKSAKNQ